MLHNPPYASFLALVLGSALAAAQNTSAQTAPKPLPRSEGFFGLHFDLHPNPRDKALGADLSEENVGKLLTRVRPDYIQYDCKGHVGYLGYPDSKIGPSAPGIVKDSLAVWRKATREHGVALLIHYSGLFDMAAIARNPAYAVVNADGQPDKNATSVFGPYVDQVMIPQLREAFTRYDLDGAWVDGECWAARLDCSPAALDAWKKETGSAEAPKKRGDPRWAEWKEFQRRHFERYVGHWVDAVHASHPKVQVASNWLYTTFMPRPVTVKLDYLSGDYDPLASVDRGRVEGRYLASTGRPWDLLAWGFVTAHAGMGHNLKPAVHLEQEAAVVLMLGGGFGIYYNPTRSGYITDTIINNAGQVADFCRARQAVSFRTQPVPQVALLMSTAAIEDRSDNVGSTWGTFEELVGTLHALLELHYSVDILAEHQIRGHLKDYPLIVVPDFEQFKPGMCEELTEYARDGGRLLLVGEKCARLFEPALGVRLEGPPRDVPAELSSRSSVVSVNGTWQTVALTTASATGYRYSDRNITRDGQIAATINTYGQGSVGAIYGPVGVRFLKQHHPYLREFIGQVAREVWPHPDLEIDGPPCLDVALRRTARNQIVVHMLNRANVPLSAEHSLIDFVPSIGPIGIRLRLPERPRRATLVPDSNELKWSWSEGLFSTTVPSLHVHAAVVVE